MKTAESSSNTNGSHHEDQAGQPPAGGRDARGRFAAGNKYGPGNPFARQTAELRKVLLEVVSPEEMRQVALTLLLLAKAGKLEATRLLFQYVLGKPAESVDPDRLEVEEWKLSRESRVNPVAVKETVDDMPAEAANVLVRHVWPASTETNYLSPAREELDAMDREDAERARAAGTMNEGIAAPTEANGSDGEERGAPAETKKVAEQKSRVPRRGERASENGGAGPKPSHPRPPSRGPGKETPEGGYSPKTGRSPVAHATEANGSNGHGRGSP